MKVSTAAMIVLLVAAPTRAGQFELLSTASTESDTGTGRGFSNSYPFPPAFSSNDRWVTFDNAAVNLAAGQRDRNAAPDVFLLDRQTGTTVLVSHASGSSVTAGDARSEAPTISDDGRWVIYRSSADNLVPGQVASQFTKTFLYDRDTGINTHVADGEAAEISGDGNWIAHGDGWNVHLRERATGQTVLVSRAAGTQTGGNHYSGLPSISDDGRYVAFLSQASDLVPGFSSATHPTDTNVYLFDRVTGSMTLVSRTGTSASTGAGGCWGAAVSPGGGSVAFTSSATNFVPGQIDFNNSEDLFLFDRTLGTNVLVSHSPASLVNAGGASRHRADFQVSADGAYVVFAMSEAPIGDIRLFRRADSELILVSRSSTSPTQSANDGSLRPRLTPDAAFVVFESFATDLVAGQNGPPNANIFLFDREAGTVALASGSHGSGQTTANWISTAPAVSDDGSVTAFHTWSTDLTAGTVDLNENLDLALYDRAAAMSTLATLPAPGMASVTPSSGSTLAAATPDGRYAVFASGAINLIPGQVGGHYYRPNLFLLDRDTGITALVSRKAGLPATVSDGQAGHAVISADGAYVAFLSDSGDLVPGQVEPDIYDPTSDVFLFDRAAGTTTLVSHAAGSAVTAGDFPSYGPMALSADGRYLAFTSYAGNLVPDQVSDAVSVGPTVFLYDRVAGTTTLVSRKAGTTATEPNNLFSTLDAISEDGRWIAFHSRGTDLVPGAVDTNPWDDVFLFDRDSGQTLLVSRAAGTAATAANHRSESAAMTPDGRHVAFLSLAGNLVPGQIDTVDTPDVFLFDRVTGTVELISRTAGSATTAAPGAISGLALSHDGRHVAFRSNASNLVPGQISGTPKYNVFVHDRVSRTTELISRAGRSPLQTSNDYSRTPAISPDGRYVAFFSNGTDLTAGGPGIFLFDRQLQALERIGDGSGHMAGTDLPFVPLFGGGAVLFTSGSLDLVPGDHNGDDDVFAYMRTPPAAGDFFTVAPCRLLDTRLPADGPALASGTPATLKAAGACGIPEGATAVAINVTSYQPAAPGRLTVHPGNLATSTSTLNFSAGQTRSNNAVMPLALNGEGTLGITPVLEGGGTVHVIVDVSGYFQ